MRWPRAPLVHFLAGGAALFCLAHVRSPGVTSPIVVTAGDVARLRLDYTRETGLEPTADDEAALVAKSLVEANLCGHDSHGVMRLPYYLDCVTKKEVVPGAPLEIIRESDSLVVADGHWGFGQTQAGKLMGLILEKAKQTGVGVGTLIHSGHIGRLGEYCEQAAAAGMVSMIMVNTHGHARRVAPPRLGWCDCLRPSGARWWGHR